MRLIDADKLLKTIDKTVCRACDCHFGVVCATCKMDDAVNLIDQAETVDAVPVVRCRECRYCEKSYRGLHCDIVGDNLLPDFYCACGERKEDK